MKYPFCYVVYTNAFDSADDLYNEQGAAIRPLKQQTPANPQQVPAPEPHLEVEIPKNAYSAKPSPRRLGEAQLLQKQAGGVLLDCDEAAQNAKMSNF